MITTTYCPFCDTTQNYRYITESETMRVIYPKAPACKYHVLIVPKRHAAQFDLLTQQEAADTYLLLQRLVQKARTDIDGFIGYNILSNNGGPAVRQHVMHAHLHVFLRTSSDTADPLLPGDSARPPELTDDQRVSLQELQLMFKVRYNEANE